MRARGYIVRAPPGRMEEEEIEFVANRRCCGWSITTSPHLTLTMTTNGSSTNSANIITALGNAFKDPSGATMSNDRLAAVLLQNMSQLTDLAKQGKLNHQQIMQVRQ